MRRGTCIVLRLTETTFEGQDRTTYYGPFLPHAGSATQYMIGNLYDEAEQRGSQNVAVTFEEVFIGTNESDCAVVATR